MTRLPVLVFLRNISLYTGRNLIYMCYIYMCVHSVFLYQIVQGLKRQSSRTSLGFWLVSVKFGL